MTHHVEEIPPGFTRALLLRAGRVAAAGALDEILTDRYLSDCFGVPVRVRREDGRYVATASTVAFT